MNLGITGIFHLTVLMKVVLVKELCRKKERALGRERRYYLCFLMLKLLFLSLMMFSNTPKKKKAEFPCHREIPQNTTGKRQNRHKNSLYTWF